MKSCLGTGTPVGEMLENAFGMGSFLARLLGKVSAESLEISDVTPDGERQIGVGGCQFLIELAVEFFNDFVGNFGF